MASLRVFGQPRAIQGKAGTFNATLVPLDLLGHSKLYPIPITVSGTSNRTFTVNASVSNPVYFWDGFDFVSLKETLAHSFSTGSTNTAIATTGARATAQTPGSVGVRYYYLGLDSAGAVSLEPSTVAPSYVEGPFPGTVLGHPGVARDRVWRYVGFSFMSATTPTFDYFVKTGHCYSFSNHAYAGVNTQPGAVTLSVVPAILGVSVGGFCTGQVTGQAVELGQATNATLTNAAIGIWKGTVAGTSVGAVGAAFLSFDNLPVTSAGDLVVHAEATATSVNVIITKVYDIV